VQTSQITTGPLTFDTLRDGPDDGALVLLLHGFPQTAEAWSGIIPELAGAGYRVVAPAQRGYSPGARPADVSSYGIEQLTADTLAIADSCGADRFHVVGHDWGGAVAWKLAADHPDRLLSVTSLSTPHPRAMASVAWRSTQLLQSAYIPFFRLPKVPETVLSARDGAVLRATLERSGLDRSSAERYTRAMLAPGALTAALNWYRAASPRLSRTSPSVAPTLYVWSSRDAALGRAAAEETARHVEGAYRFEVLEGVSHWIPEEAAERVSALLLEHLGAT
jgi:pimeloyl-ACP methyl ester carboxylesterase